MNISYPNLNSGVYHQFLDYTSQRVSAMMTWLSERNIDYVWNYWADNHLYRLYIPVKDLLLDFECYPVNNVYYNYIRVDYDTDVIGLLHRIFPDTLVDTNDMDIWKLNQRTSNRFLKDNGVSPVYDKSALRIALVKDQEIYQCVVVKNQTIVADVTKRNCAVPYGTYILLRYLNEIFGAEHTIIKINMNNSYDTLMYQVLNTPVISKTSKKKIWWSPDGTKWRIDKKDTYKYVPFYLTETITYRYPN